MAPYMRYDPSWVYIALKVVDSLINSLTHSPNQSLFLSLSLSLLLSLYTFSSLTLILPIPLCLCMFLCWWKVERFLYELVAKYDPLQQSAALLHSIACAGTLVETLSSAMLGVQML